MKYLLTEKEFEKLDINNKINYKYVIAFDLNDTLISTFNSSDVNDNFINLIDGAKSYTSKNNIKIIVPRILLLNFIKDLKENNYRVVLISYSPKKRINNINKILNLGFDEIYIQENFEDSKFKKENNERVILIDDNDINDKDPIEKNKLLAKFKFFGLKNDTKNYYKIHSINKKIKNRTLDDLELTQKLIDKIKIKIKMDGKI